MDSVLAARERERALGVAREWERPSLIAHRLRDAGATRVAGGLVE
jgi:hypothetical protein